MRICGKALLHGVYIYMIYFFMLVYLYIYNILDVINFLQLVYCIAIQYVLEQTSTITFPPIWSTLTPTKCCVHTRTAPLCAARIGPLDHQRTINERQGWWQIGDP